MKSATSTKRRRTTWIIAAGAVVALGAIAAFAGPIIYRDLIAPPAAEQPSSDFDDLAESTISDDELAGDWSVSDGSYAGYRVDEVLNGVDVTVTARTEKVTGTVTSDGSAITAASITVDVASIETGETGRDNYFRNTAMRVGEFPEATFELTGVIEPQSEPDPETPQTVTGSGVLTLAGESRDVTVEITAAADGGTVRVAGAIAITFSDFGVTAPDLGFVKVEDAGFVEFMLVLTPA